MKTEAELRRALVDAMLALATRGLNRGTSGNVSVRFGQGILVTPSGIEAQNLNADDMVYVHGDGQWDQSARRPSSEWRMHYPLSSAIRHDFGLCRQADPGRTLHGRGQRWGKHTNRAICPVWNGCSGGIRS
jgi:hypothetical protein